MIIAYKIIRDVWHILDFVTPSDYIYNRYDTYYQNSAKCQIKEFSQIKMCIRNLSENKPNCLNFKLITIFIKVYNIPICIFLYDFRSNLLIWDNYQRLLLLCASDCFITYSHNVYLGILWCNHVNLLYPLDNYWGKPPYEISICRIYV